MTVGPMFAERVSQLKPAYRTFVIGDGFDGEALGHHKGCREGDALDLDLRR